ncbi:MAG: aminoglycoside phosphotransferase family protein [Gemmiger sp.]|nr:aminoglycoside phosphotransferase family protein [Gemmiger sp.]
MSELLENQEILSAWDWGGVVAGVLPYGEGHINATKCVYVQTSQGGSRRYILQKINTDTFTDPDGLMENICGVTEYLRKTLAAQGLDADRGTMQVILTTAGRPYFRAADGGCWRVYAFVEDTICLQKVETPEDFYESAVAFGNFQRQLAGYPAATLHETIARFHDTPNRYAMLEKAVAADAYGRVAEVAKELAFVTARQSDCHYMTDLLAAGKLPLRVTHNDTKLNNILMDKTTRKGICVIDLDTVMPGLAANDFGDSIRFGANHSAEDEPDLSKVNFSLPLFETYAKGFMQAVGDAFTPLEKETLPWGAKLMTLECGIRFLTDYLEGDHYFHTTRPGQNLDRARTQFKLVADMEAAWPEMAQIIKKYS